MSALGFSLYGGRRRSLHRSRRRTLRGGGEGPSTLSEMSGGRARNQRRTRNQRRARNRSQSRNRNQRRN